MMATGPLKEKTHVGASEIFPPPRRGPLPSLAADPQGAWGFDSPELAYVRTVGRFVQNEPLLGSRAWDHYVYVLNRPTVGLDPTGLQAESQEEQAKRKLIIQRYQEKIRELKSRLEKGLPEPESRSAERELLRYQARLAIRSHFSPVADKPYFRLFGFHRLERTLIFRTVGFRSELDRTLGNPAEYRRHRVTGAERILIKSEDTFSIFPERLLHEVWHAVVGERRPDLAENVDEALGYYVQGILGTVVPDFSRIEEGVARNNKEAVVDAWNFLIDRSLPMLEDKRNRLGYGGVGPDRRGTLKELTGFSIDLDAYRSDLERRLPSVKGQLKERRE